jgi:PAS domain S-box-containing protein
VSGVDYLLAEALPQLIWVTDADGSVEYVNSKYEEYTGYSCAELRGHTEWRKALHPDDLERCLRAWQTATKTETVFETEYRLRRVCDGAWRWHLTRALPVRDPQGRIVKWFGTCTEIEEQKQESRRKDELLAMLGHELRNPLAPILNAVQLLRERGEHGLESDIVERQARHMARLIDDLLDVSRINSGRIQLRKEACDLGPIVDTAVEATLALIEQRGHRLVVDLGAEPLIADGDPVRLAQVLTNLLNNAA